MRFGTSRRQESRSATGWSITTTEDRIPRLTISRRASSMLGFGLCLWQHNVGSQIPPYVCCRTVQRMGSTSLRLLLDRPHTTFPLLPCRTLDCDACCLSVRVHLSSTWTRPPCPLQGGQLN